MSAPSARAIRSSFTEVSPENTTEPSGVSNRYASAGTARPCVTATEVTRTLSSSTTTTGTWVRSSVHAAAVISMARTSMPASGIWLSSGMTFRW